MPRFPIPKLEDTLQRYKDVSKALLSDSEFAQVSKSVDAFAQGSGPELQRLLLELEKEAPYNWMEGFWQSMYLDLRCPMPVNVNPFLILGDDPNIHKNSSQVLKAASLVAAATRFAILARTEQIEPEKAGDSLLCMNGYTQLVGSTRIPLFGRDKYVVCKTSRHVAVLSHGIPYYLEVLDTQGAPIPEPDLIRQLQSILNDSVTRRFSAESLYPVGVLTTENRDVWAGVKQQLGAFSDENSKSLQLIDDALFVVCLDDTAPKDMTDFSKISLYGNARNRYYDKLQIIVTIDGQAALNMEHTGYDGQILARFMLDLYADAIQSKFNMTSTGLPSPKPLLVRTNASLQGAIDKATANWNAFVNVNDLEVLSFTDFGKNKIKNFQIPPDAFFQIAAQIANKRTFGKVVSTYESSSVRNYQHGRTETIRPLTIAARTFVDNFEKTDIPAKKKYELLQQAGKAHQTVVKNSKTGLGVDRHLQGLYWTALQKSKRIYQFELPTFFTDGYYSNYMSNKCSTSNVGGDFQAIKLFGFGAVHEDGVGVGYLVNSDSLVMAITSYSNKAKTWKDNMTKALKDLQALCEEAQR
uniref:Choline/carnitine acyltransferase domain-containing protein n=1 Tax=Arcella intermedia TaxID=1963864 RepID=A0A6B2L0M0_9EUKA